LVLALSLSRTDLKGKVLRFAFISTPTFEEWDWTNPDAKGIGGSETSHIEMAQRLARRGHEVLSYAPTPYDGPVTDPAGVVWRRIQQMLSEPVEAPDVWVVYRAPHVIDMLPDDAVIWHINQDVDYSREGDALTEDRCKRLTRLVALCNTHGEYLKYMHPAANVVVSSNGIKRGFIDEIAANPPERNPRRLMYASSPDRGMEFLLQIFPRVREMVPDLELHIYYGFDNIEKVVDFVGKNHRIAMNTERLKALLTQPGVHYHGRLGQRELLGEWFKAGLWVHPSNFTETSCITCMDAQACGAIPITSPVWAIAENVEHGVFVHGNVQNELIRARYVLEVFRMVVQAEAQDAIRADMMPWARDRFDWERFVDQWEDWARADLEARSAKVAISAETADTRGTRRNWRGGSTRQK
jgi:glycosyltransferase involved in cell wall biosynthesis